MTEALSAHRVPRLASAGRWLGHLLVRCAVVGAAYGVGYLLVHSSTSPSVSPDYVSSLGGGAAAVALSLPWAFVDGRRSTAVWSVVSLWLAVMVIILGVVPETMVALSEARHVAESGKPFNPAGMMLWAFAWSFVAVPAGSLIPAAALVGYATTKSQRA